MDKLVELLSSSINPAIVYQTSGGGEGRAPLNFQGGVKSLFLISDIFDELVWGWVYTFKSIKTTTIRTRKDGVLPSRNSNGKSERV